MENINTLLVAFMFITILTLGIASVLAELAEVVRHLGRAKRDGLLVGWTLLLLFAYFTLFWHTADIALLEDWNFGLFLFAETGPVLLLFATQIMLGALSTDLDEDPEAAMSQGRFFVIFALLGVWSICVGFVLGFGFTIESALDLVVIVTCLLLAFSKSQTVHVAGLAVVWITYLCGSLLDLAA